MSKIVIIGSGARECAILMKLKKSNSNNRYVFITIGTSVNPYMFNQSNFVFVENYEVETITNLNLFRDDIFMVVIGPEAPLVNGLENRLRERNIFTIAPSKESSKIEWSKIYARKLLNNDNTLQKYNPKFGDLREELGFDISKDLIVDSILKFRNITSSDVVIKKDGLCGGKGVFVEGDHFNISTREDFTYSSLIADLEEYMKTNENTIVLEEKLTGIEFSLMSLVDQNENLVHFEPIFDYKRLNDGDTGPNTGSMGAILLDYESQKKYLGLEALLAAQKVNEMTIKVLNADTNDKYKGILYGSFMKLDDGSIRVIEFNSRFGDPEGALALMNIHNDLISVFAHVQTNTLDKVLIKSKGKNVAGVYCVPKSYGLPVSKAKYEPYDIFFRGNMESVHKGVLENRIFEDLSLVYGSCNYLNKNLKTANSRTILVLSSSEYLYKAVNMIYRNIDGIVSNIKYRTDIGAQFISKYESAGISIDNANTSIIEIKKALKSTYNNNVESELGDFGGIYNLEGHQLVSSIDGVGTKTDFVDNYYKKEDYYGLGQDIVNHCINDILVMGAKPLFFLDYYGTSMLDREQFRAFVSGACLALGGICNEDEKIPLIGGETAEMPSVYNTNKNDVVGCIIGKLDRTFVNFSREVQKGDVLFALPSFGPHTNGFSLINRVDWRSEFLKRNNKICDLTLSEFLDNLKNPHKNYYPTVKYFTNVYGTNSIVRMCHITGGGLTENLRRVVKSDLNIKYSKEKLAKSYPNWCRVIEEVSETSKEEMYRVFNCGIGFVLILSPRLKESMEIDKIFSFTEIGVIE